MANGRGVSDDDIDALLRSKKRGVKKLNGDGDFRSEECIEYLKQADIVVTNPPFSLFRVICIMRIIFLMAVIFSIEDQFLMALVVVEVSIPANRTKTPPLLSALIYPKSCRAWLIMVWHPKAGGWVSLCRRLHQRELMLRAASAFICPSNVHNLLM